MGQLMSGRLCCGFVTGRSSRCRNLMIRAKYAVMKRRGVTYPDVYAIPSWIGASCDFLGNGARISAGRYEMIFSELNADAGQLEYLAHLVNVHRNGVAVLPGPGKIFLSIADAAARRHARRILRGAGHVLAYSPQVRLFADALAGGDVAKMTPWPFDYAAVREIAGRGAAFRDQKIRVLIGVPLRFHGIACNRPDLIEQCLADALGELSPLDRDRFSFHAFVYGDDDRCRWLSSRFGKTIGTILERRRSFRGFVRFVDGCDAVINLSAVSVLGRNTFISAALGKPGIFSNNVDLNRRLYPNATVQDAADAAFRTKVRGLAHGLLRGAPDKSFFADACAAQSVGDYSGNADAFRRLLRL